MRTTALLNIKAVSRQTGLSAHVIRVWEKRYRAVVPQRTATNRRLYGTNEVERLNLLARATRAGHTISQVASLTTDTLRNLPIAPAPGPDTPAKPVTTPKKPQPDFIEQALDAIRSLDTAALEKTLHAAELALGQMGLLCKVLSPLLVRLGEDWRAGEIRAAHEHLASQVIRSFLGNLSRHYAAPENAPEIVVATPLGQLHELGAFMAAATAHHSGWRVTYLGPGLPAEEIAGAARQKNARAVALSLVHPEDDPRLPRELEKLRACLPAETQLLVGGRAIRAYAPTLRSLNAVVCTNLSSLQEALDTVRSSRTA